MGAVLAFAGLIFLVAPTSAQVINPLDNPGTIAVYVVGKIVELYVSVVGWICLQLVYILLIVASYNNFVNSEAVTQGWSIVRDVVNMFFILILLVIAFATIFNVSEYKYQKMLPRLLIMAVVINFSRTIAGLLIDLGQVVMLTFVNGFKAAAGANFVNALRINELLQWNQMALMETANNDVTLYIFVGYLLAAIMVTVAAVVLAVMVFMLVMRVVVLWFLIVLSPAAFLSSVWPSGRLKANYGKWWDMLLDNILAGPILAFFLWLSLLVLGSGTIGGTEFIDTATKAGIIQGSGEALPTIGKTKVGTPENMISYIIAIGMLLGSLYMAQSMRSAGSGIAGSALGKIKGYASGAIRKPVGWAKRGVGAGAEAAKRRTTFGTRDTAIKILSQVKGPVVGTMARRVIGGMRQKQQAESAKYTKYLSGLSPDEIKAEGKKLEGAQTSVGQARRQVLESKRLYETGKMEHTAENVKEAQKRAAFLKSRAGFDPEIIKSLDEASKKRPDLFLSDERNESAKNEEDRKSDLEKYVSHLDAKEALSTRDEAFGSKSFVEYIRKNSALVEAIEKSGSQKKREALAASQAEAAKGSMGATEAAKRTLREVTVEDFKEMISNRERSDFMTDDDIGKKLDRSAQEPEFLKALMDAGRIDPLVREGTLNIQNADLKMNGGSLAKKIAESTSEALKKRARNEKRGEYADGLIASMQKPGDHSAARGELLRMGTDLDKIYKYNEERGSFENTEEERRFVADIEKNTDAIPKVAGSLSGDAQNAVFKRLTADDYIKYARRAKNTDDKMDLQLLLGKLEQFSKSAEAGDGIRETVRQLKGMGALSGYFKKEEPKIAGGAREIEMEAGPELEIDGEKKKV